MADEMEYAVRRVSDGRYLWDDDLDGVYQSWQKDPENASWLDTEAEALNLAVLADVAEENDEIELKDGYEIASRPIAWEDDLQPDPDDPNPEW